ncbi:hypothetical protein MRX96_004124 [Rhipicephalus microplus]
MKASSKGVKRKALSEVQQQQLSVKGLLLSRKPAEAENCGRKEDSSGSGQYWKELAEQRRVALEEALKENEQEFAREVDHSQPE